MPFASRRHGTFVVSFTVLCLHALCFCCRACYCFPANCFRMTDFPARHRGRLCGRPDVTLCFCVGVCTPLAGLVPLYGCVCIHHSVNMCVLNIFCICVLFSFFFLSFFPPFISFTISRRSCLCASALNEYSHRINSHMIKQLQRSTHVQHGAQGWERGGGKEQKETQRMQQQQHKKKEKRRVKGVRRSEGLEGDAHHCQARLGALPRPSSSSSTTSSSPLDDLAPLRQRREKGNGRRIYCWVLTCTHSWCCFSPLGPSAIPKASKTTGCQVVTAGFKQLLQQPCT